MYSQPWSPTPSTTAWTRRCCARRSARRPRPGNRPHRPSLRRGRRCPTMMFSAGLEAGRPPGTLTDDDGPPHSPLPTVVVGVALDDEGSCRAVTERSRGSARPLPVQLQDVDGVVGEPFLPVTSATPRIPGSCPRVRSMFRVSRRTRDARLLTALQRRPGLPPGAPCRATDSSSSASGPAASQCTDRMFARRASVEAAGRSPAPTGLPVVRSPSPRRSRSTRPIMSCRACGSRAAAMILPDLLCDPRARCSCTTLLRLCLRSAPAAPGPGSRFPPGRCSGGRRA